MDKFSVLTAVMHMLIHIDNYEHPLQEEVEESAVKTAINFIQLTCQRTAYIAGKETLQEEDYIFKAGRDCLSSSILVCYKNGPFRIDTSNLPICTCYIQVNCTCTST